MKERNYDVVKTVVGILLAAIGFVLLRRYADSQGVMAVLPFVCIGVGCGAFGHGMGGMLSRKALKGSPDLQKQLEIEQKDERNIAISNSAKGKAFDIMLFVYGALMLSFALMQVDLAAILLFVFCYLLVLGCSIYYRVKYEKEMSKAREAPSPLLLLSFSRSQPFWPNANALRFSSSTLAGTLASREACQASGAMSGK